MSREQHQPLIDENSSRFANNNIHWGAVFEEDKCLCDAYVSEQSRMDFPNLHELVENIMSEGLAKAITAEVNSENPDSGKTDLFFSFENDLATLQPEYEGRLHGIGYVYMPQGSRNHHTTFEIFICVSTKDKSGDPAHPRKEASLFQEFLKDLQKRFTHDMRLQEAGGVHNIAIVGAEAYGEKLRLCAIDAMEKINGRAIQIDKKIDVSKHQIIKTMELQLNRTYFIEQNVAHAEKLQAAAAVFAKEAKMAKRRVWWKDCKTKYCLICIVVTILLVAGVVFVCHIDLSNCLP